MIAIKKDAMRYRNPETGEFVGVSLIGGNAPSDTPVEIDGTLTQSGKAADAKAVGDQISALNAANATQDERLNTLEQASGIVTVEPADDDIPKLYFTGTTPTSKSEGNVQLFLRYVSRTARIEKPVTLKVQGDSSASYPKKNFTMTFYTDSTYVNKEKLTFKGWPSMNKFVLKAHWMDHSHVRNVGTAKIWGKIVASRSDYASLPEELRTSANNGATDGFTCKVFVNGVYQGLYELIVPKYKLYGQTTGVATHSILNSEQNNQATCAFATTSPTISGNWSEELQDSMSSVISTSFANFIKFVAGATDEEFVANAETYFDVQSVIDFDIFARVFCIVDNVCKNQIFFTYDGMKWYEGAWDMDGVLGNPPTVRGYFAYNTEFQSGYVAYKDHGITNLLYERVETLFMDRFKARYAELRADILSADNIVDVYERLTDVITTYDGLLEEDYASTTGGGAFTGMPYKTENTIQQIRNFVAARLPYMDEQVEAIAPPAEQIPCTGITLDQTELTFSASGTQTLIATVTPSNTTDTVVWSSDDPSIASVSNGIVTAKANGIATITATCGAYSATCAVSVSGIEEVVIPSEYVELKYIESSGTQYIDTGVSGGSTSAWEMKLNVLGTAPHPYEQYMGSDKTSINSKIYCHNKIDVRFASKVDGNIHAFDFEDAVHTVSAASDGTLQVDGATITGKGLVGGWGTITSYVFNSHGESTQASSMRLYYYKMWKDGELVRDFVPVKRVSDGVYGLYDLVGATFYENIGTGSFTGEYLAPIPCTGITLDQSTLTFTAAGTQELTATVTPSYTTDTVEWSSDAPSIASVSGGVVVAKANGSATITATCGAYSATCAVSVSGIEESTEPPALINVDSSTLKTGDTVWTDANGVDVFNLSSAATVDNDGLLMSSANVTAINTVALTGKFTAETTFTLHALTSGDSSYSLYGFNLSNTTKYCDSIFSTGVYRVRGYDKDLDTNLFLEVGKEITVRTVYDEDSISVYCSGKTIGTYNKNSFTANGGYHVVLGWTSSNSVLSGRNFSIKRFRLWDESVHCPTAPCTSITLDQTELTFDSVGSQTLTAIVTPSDTTDIVVWSSDAPSIASVRNGVVTAKSNGIATITATCGAYSATCAVSVSGITEPPALINVNASTLSNGDTSWKNLNGTRAFVFSKGITIDNDGLLMSSAFVNADNSVSLNGEFTAETTFTCHSAPSGREYVPFAIWQGSSTKYCDSINSALVYRVRGFDADVNTDAAIELNVEITVRTVYGADGKITVYKNGLLVGEYTRNKYTAQGDYAIYLGKGSMGQTSNTYTGNNYSIKAFRFWDSAVHVPKIPCTGITLDKTELTFDSAGTQTLTATVTPSDTTDTVAWSSNAPSIASVNGGVVTAKANGSATITATCGEYSASCAVSVSGIETGGDVTTFSLEEGSKTFENGSTLSVSGTQVAYNNAQGAGTGFVVNASNVSKNGDSNAYSANAGNVNNQGLAYELHSGDVVCLKATRVSGSLKCSVFIVGAGSSTSLVDTGETTTTAEKTETMTKDTGIGSIGIYAGLPGEVVMDIDITVNGVSIFK